MTTITGEQVRLRTAVASDLAALVAIRATPEVYATWRGDDLAADVAEAIESDELHFLVIENTQGELIGGIQWEAETDPDYRHANIDIFLEPTFHRRGYGSDAVAALVKYLFEVEGHHRLTIDPAADNAAGIRCYQKVGFRAVGTLRQYEQGPDGTWHDGILMELLRDDWASQP